MWVESIIPASVLMCVLSVLFYKLNVHFLYDGYLPMMLWMGIGVPVLVIALALMAASAEPPHSYTAIAGLVALANGMVGLGLKVLGMRSSQSRR